MLYIYCFKYLIELIIELYIKEIYKNNFN